MRDMVVKLNPKALGISAGIIGGVVAFLMTLFAVATGYDTAAMLIYASFHPGYSISIVGAFVGLVYSFVCWLVVGYVLALLYNKFDKKWG